MIKNGLFALNKINIDDKYLWYCMHAKWRMFLKLFTGFLINIGLPCFQENRNFSEVEHCLNMIVIVSVKKYELLQVANVFLYCLRQTLFIICA